MEMRRGHRRFDANCRNATRRRWNANNQGKKGNNTESKRKKGQENTTNPTTTIMKSGRIGPQSSWIPPTIILYYLKKLEPSEQVTQIDAT